MLVDDEEEVLVEESWFKRKDLPKILGNYMRSSREYAMQLKEECIRREQNMTSASVDGNTEGFDQNSVSVDPDPLIVLMMGIGNCRTAMNALEQNPTSIEEVINTFGANMHQLLLVAEYLLAMKFAERASEYAKQSGPKA